MLGGGRTETNKYKLYSISEGGYVPWKEIKKSELLTTTLQYLSESNVRSGVWRGKEKINFRISKLNTELHNQRPVNEFFIILLLVVFGCAGSPLLGGLSLVEHMEATRSLSRCVRGLLAAAASLLWSTGSRARLTSCGSWASLLCGVWGSSWIRDWTCVSCIGRWMLYHWARREALKMIFFLLMRTSISSHHGVTGIGFTLPPERFKNKSKKQNTWENGFQDTGYQTVGGQWFLTNRKRMRWALLFTSLTDLRGILGHGTGGGGEGELKEKPPMGYPRGFWSG